MSIIQITPFNNISKIINNYRVCKMLGMDFVLITDTNPLPQYADITVVGYSTSRASMLLIYPDLIEFFDTCPEEVKKCIVHSYIASRNAGSLIVDSKVVLTKEAVVSDVLRPGFSHSTYSSTVANVDIIYSGPDGYLNPFISDAVEKLNEMNQTNGFIYRNSFLRLLNRYINDGQATIINRDCLEEM